MHCSDCVNHLRYAVLGRSMIKSNANLYLMPCLSLRTTRSFCLQEEEVIRASASPLSSDLPPSYFPFSLVISCLAVLLFVLPKYPIEVKLRQRVVPYNHTLL